MVVNLVESIFMRSSKHSLSPPLQNVTRRQFFGASAVAVGFLTARISGVGAERSPRLKVGFLGTGYSHFAEKFKLLRDSTDFELIGLCEEDDVVRANGPKDARWLTREQLFGEVEVVVVESGLGDHARHAKLALEAGKHVHLEKPPADSLAAFRDLVRLAQEKKRVLQIGYMWRYNPGINGAIEAARQGWLGEVYLARATINTLIDDPSKRRQWASFRGGALFELGSHLVDALVRLLGKPVKVTPFLKQSGQFNDMLADNTVAVFEFPRSLGIITCTSLQPNAGGHRTFEVLGTNGTVRVQPLEPPALTIDLANPAGPYASGKQQIKLPPYQRYVDEFTALAAAIREEKPLPVSFEQELIVQDTLMRACDML